MHIQKNCFDSVMNTFMNLKGKSKDTIKSRSYITLFYDRPHLHVDNEGQAPFPPYTLDEDEIKSLL